MQGMERIPPTGAGKKGMEICHGDRKEKIRKKIILGQKEKVWTGSNWHRKGSNIGQERKGKERVPRKRKRKTPTSTREKRK